MSELHDYSFIDKKRVLSYFEQIKAPNDLQMKEKCPAWDVSISLTGPKVQGRQTTTLRPPTIYEAIAEVETYLSNTHLISTLDNCDNYWVETWEKGKTAFFIKDTFKGCRAFIHPPEKASKIGIKPIGFWLLDPIIHKQRKHYLPGDAATLKGFLIEYCNESDINDVTGASGFTALDFLLYTLEEHESELRDLLLEGKQLPKGSRYDHRNDQRFIRFARDPYDYLEKLGVHIGPKKSICSLFRVRHIWDEDGYHTAGSHENMGVVGYPIYIREMLV